MCKPVVFRGSRHVGAELEPGVSARRGRCGARVLRLWRRVGVAAGSGLPPEPRLTTRRVRSKETDAEYSGHSRGLATDGAMHPGSQSDDALASRLRLLAEDQRGPTNRGQGMISHSGTVLAADAQ